MFDLQDSLPSSVYLLSPDWHSSASEIRLPKVINRTSHLCCCEKGQRFWSDWWIPRLSWDFSGCTCHFVCFGMRRLYLFLWLFHRHEQLSYGQQRLWSDWWIPRLIWVFSGCTCNFVGFGMRRLSLFLWLLHRHEQLSYGPRQANLVLIAYASSEDSGQNLRCLLIQAVSQEEPSDRKPDPWPLWMTGHAQLKFVMMECSKTRIRVTRLIWTLFQTFGSSL